MKILDNPDVFKYQIGKHVGIIEIYENYGLIFKDKFELSTDTSADYRIYCDSLSVHRHFRWFISFIKIFENM